LLLSGRWPSAPLATRLPTPEPFMPLRHRSTEPNPLLGRTHTPPVRPVHQGASRAGRRQRSSNGPPRGGPGRPLAGSRGQGDVLATQGPLCPGKRRVAEKWVWAAIDLVTTRLRTIDVGDRTRALAQRVVHQVVQI